MRATKIFLVFLVICDLYSLSWASGCSSDEIEAPCGANGKYPENICPDIQKLRPGLHGTFVLHARRFL
ncbi:hypothetical protein V5799_006751 [Amblyomma americanum]|uniref:Secreted protein n=1 Tax=Amblyomma americanum TaxID=6943 RepID=A0AAQ4DVH8_AMBAM